MLFPLGRIVATPGALQALEEAGQSPMEFLDRHAVGDWGELDEEDKQTNNYSVRIIFQPNIVEHSPILQWTSSFETTVYERGRPLKLFTKVKFEKSAECFVPFNTNPFNK